MNTGFITILVGKGHENTINFLDLLTQEELASAVGNVLGKEIPTNIVFFCRTMIQKNLAFSEFFLLERCKKY